MSVSHPLTSQQLRVRAEECRSLASTFQAGEGRDRMLNVAAEFDHIATAAERLERDKMVSSDDRDDK